MTALNFAASTPPFTPPETVCARSDKAQALQ
jgi:hypothetical protein